MARARFRSGVHFAAPSPSATVAMWASCLSAMG